MIFTIFKQFFCYLLDFMANKRKISFRLSKELDEWVKAEIESGRFESLTQAVEESLVLLQERLDGEKQ